MVFILFYLFSLYKLADIHTLVLTLAKETLKGTLPFLCSEFSGVHCISPTYYRYILQSRNGVYKGTHFLIFLLKIFKDCDNLISMGRRSHIFCPRNEMDSVPCLTEFPLHLCNVSFPENYMDVRWVQIYNLK